MKNCQNQQQRPLSSMPLFIDLPMAIQASKTLQKYQIIFQQLDLSDIPNRQNHIGRKPYSRHAILKALIVQFLSGIPSIAQLVRQLDANPILAELCGFQLGAIPHPTVFIRFLKRTKTSNIENLLKKTAKRLIQQGKLSNEICIIDSKPILANTKHNNPKNPTRILNKDKMEHPSRSPKATLGYFAYTQVDTSKKKTTLAWGYRVHTIINAQGVALVSAVMPNNVKDHVVAKKLIKKLKRQYGSLKGKIFIADAGYDVKELYQLIVNQMKATAIIPINPRNSKHNNDDIDPKTSTPICKAGLPMKFCGLCKEKNRTRKKFRCPIKADKLTADSLGDRCPIDCEKFDGYGCTRYIDVTNDPRSMIDRTSAFFKKLYDLRIYIEQYNSRIGPLEFERTTLFNFKAIKNQIMIRHLALALVAAGAFEMGKEDKIRSYKTLMEDSAA